MTEINILEKDCDDNPSSFTVHFEVPGNYYNQNFPKRFKHTFPDQGHWNEKVKLNGEEIPRFEKLLVERYIP